MSVRQGTSLVIEPDTSFDEIDRMDRTAPQKKATKNHSKAPAHREEIIPRELLDLSPNLIFVLADDSTTVEVNKLAAEILQKEEEELLHSSFCMTCAPEERERIQKLIRECLTTSTTLSSQIKLVSRQGKIIDLDLTASRYPNSDKAKKRYCVLIGRDVSEERRKELDLLRFSNIAHFTVNPLEITDVNGKIIYVNPAFEKTSGYSRDELIGNNPNVFGSGKHPKVFWERMWKTITSGKVWTGEIENRKKNGEPFFTSLLVSPIIDTDGKLVGYFGVHRDITGQKHLEKQLVHAQKMESIGMLAAGLAHEVGNPLTSISSLVQVIQRTTQDEFTQEKLVLIKSQITRISRIIRDLVDFSRRSSYEVQLTDVNKSLHEAVEIVRVGKKAKNISFLEKLDNGIPRFPLVPDQIEQVFINILINAVDAINSSVGVSPEKQGNITVTSKLSEENAVISIQDNGSGIAEEALPQIFEPFYTTKKVGEGTGLGLWVSYGIIKSFQGNIKVESVEHKGTTFTISLPLHTELF